MGQRKPRQEITKAYLESMGFLEPVWSEDRNNWIIYRFWPYGYKTKPVMKEMAISKAVCKHKYGKDKAYYKITFSAHQERINITLSRFIYAWFKNIAPADMDVEHLNNDPLDNRLENLRLSTRTDNLRKRFIDNPGNAKNQ